MLTTCVNKFGDFLLGFFKEIVQRVGLTDPCDRVARIRADELLLGQMDFC